MSKEKLRVQPIEDWSTPKGEAFDMLTEALGEYGCEFLNLEIDCPERNSERLGKPCNPLGRILRRECGCDDIIWSPDKETNRWTISCSTQTGISDN